MNIDKKKLLDKLEKRIDKLYERKLDNMDSICELIDLMDQVKSGSLDVKVWE